ncbi:MAG: HAD hydrolase-like protein [Candidatus Diapherotrites archaeon]|nr:HAD hydrolase-like protein [Candidatus Diapherotrites archaeon]
MARLKAVILDVDGTLIDSLQTIIQRHEATAKEMGLRSASREEYTRQSGKGWRTAIHDMWPDVDVEEFVSVYSRTPRKGYAAFPGAVDAVRKLKQAGFVLGIVTGKPTDSAERQLQKEGFDLEWFEFVHGEGMTPVCKPDGRVFGPALTVLGLKGITREETVYVGDSPNDEAAAAGAGIKFIAVLTGHNEKQDFGDVEVLDSIAKLPELIDGKLS